MRTTRRSALAAAGLMLGARAARAQAYPNRTIRVIVPYAAGGADQFIRPLQAGLNQALGQPVVIDSVTGGGGSIGANRVRQAPADGYTLLFAGTGALTAVPRLQKLNYSIADFAPIANLIAIPYVLAARQGAPFTDFAGFLRAARAKPEGLSYGTPGIGSTPHLVAEAMAKAAGVKLLHVPYSGVATAVVALLAGEIDLVMGAPGNIMPLVERGVVPLAQTGTRRIAVLRDLPTLREAGLEVDLVTRFGFFAPKGTDAAVIERWSRLLLEGGADPAYAQAMQRAFNEVELLAPAQFQDFLAAEDAATAQLLAALNLTTG
ncbi:Bug family tripartite tricarboxylate transporter substrate binding protein [Falsiroseomonas tokyonensis]|uniref:Bug family tripartite tricarboxylate transporter substrate binding protein n=1 Tax=Falsiroseomonas tokyonensis TaxID=430521 RepID=A0ABV7BRF6_9PROT|nr:tripartite tricarboxylate transporter substrate binding protein [Falsiroseomonas tokyonensis]MBU8537238.1 tripartite tricarboxylate transporter substrate binding protein [Falsiroseomonas tokyonensis]